MKKIIIVAFLLSLCSAVPAFGRTIIVKKSGCSNPDCKTDIQQALDQANSGDTVQLQDDFTINNTLAINTDNITFTSSGNNSIDSNSALAYLINVFSNKVKIQNIRFNKGSGNAAAGLYLGADLYGLQVSNCEFKGFVSEAIHLDSAGHPTISSSSSDRQIKISRNKFENNGTAVLVEGSSENILLESNIVSGNTNTDDGFEIGGTTINVNIKNNTFKNLKNGLIFASFFDFTNKPWLANNADSNNISSCTIGILNSNGYTILKSNAIENNKTGISITGGLPQLHSGNTIKDNKIIALLIDANNIIINDVKILNNRSGIKILGGDNVQISNSTIADNKDYGIIVENSGVNLWIVNNTITNNKINNIWANDDARIEKNAVGGSDSKISILTKGGTLDIINNGLSGDKIAVQIDGGSVNLKSNKISDATRECVLLTNGTIENFGGYGYGNDIYNCRYGLRINGGSIGSNGVKYNFFRQNSVGIQLENGAYDFERNNIHNNTDGIIVTGGAGGAFLNNQISNNANNGITIADGNLNLQYNFINNNKYGIEIKDTGSVLENNQIFSNTKQGIVINASGGANITNNIIFKNNNNITDKQVIDSGAGYWNQNYFASVSDWDRDKNGIADNATVTIPGASNHADEDPLVTSAKLGAVNNFIGSWIPLEIPPLVQAQPVGSSRKATLWCNYSLNSGASFEGWISCGTLEMDKFTPFVTPGFQLKASTTPTPGKNVIYWFQVQGSDDTLGNKELQNKTPAFVIQIDARTATPTYTFTKTETPTRTETWSPTSTKTWSPTGTYWSPTATYSFTPTFTKTPLNWEQTITRTPIYFNAASNAPNPPTGGGGSSSGGSTPQHTNTPNNNETATFIPTIVIGEDTIPDNSKPRKNFYAYAFKAEWVAQYQSSTFEGANNDGDEYFDVVPCTTIDFWADLRNVGARPWLSSNHPASNSNNEFTFATYKDPNVRSAPPWTGYDNCPHGPNCGKSYFWDSSWVSQYRIGTLENDIVYPGETGRVSAKFKIPCNAEKGRFREDISAASGNYWIYNDFNGDPLSVMHIWVGFDIR